MISFIGFPWTKIQTPWARLCKNWPAGSRECTHTTAVRIFTVRGFVAWSLVEESILWLDKLKQYWFLLKEYLTDICITLFVISQYQCPVDKFTESFKGRRQPKFLFEIKSKSREGEQLHTENYAKVKNFVLDLDLG